MAAQARLLKWHRELRDRGFKVIMPDEGDMTKLHIPLTLLEKPYEGVTLHMDFNIASSDNFTGRLAHGRLPNKYFKEDELCVEQLPFKSEFPAWLESLRIELQNESPTEDEVNVVNGLRAVTCPVCLAAGIQPDQPHPQDQAQPRASQSVPAYFVDHRDNTSPLNGIVGLRAKREARDSNTQMKRSGGMVVKVPVADIMSHARFEATDFADPEMFDFFLPVYFSAAHWSRARDLAYKSLQQSADLHSARRRLPPGPRRIISADGTFTSLLDAEDVEDPMPLSPDEALPPAFNPTEASCSLAQAMNQMIVLFSAASLATSENYFFAYCQLHRLLLQLAIEHPEVIDDAKYRLMLLSQCHPWDGPKQRRPVQKEQDIGDLLQLMCAVDMPWLDIREGFITTMMRRQCKRMDKGLQSVPKDSVPETLASVASLEELEQSDPQTAATIRWRLEESFQACRVGLRLMLCQPATREFCKNLMDATADSSSGRTYAEKLASAYDRGMGLPPSYILDRLRVEVASFQQLSSFEAIMRQAGLEGDDAIFIYLRLCAAMLTVTAEKEKGRLPDNSATPEQVVSLLKRRQILLRNFGRCYRPVASAPAAQAAQYVAEAETIEHEDAGDPLDEDLGYDDNDAEDVEEE
eukprot:m.69961 g.69961  ORF g.69961 m.69961 type:complete len:636 (+) comp14278_c0_seq3:16-1923(+)